MATLDTLTPDAIAARLSGPPEERAALVRAGAEAGVAEAQAVYGQMLLDGADVPADPRAALGWFTRAAAQHHVMALNMVGRCYDLGWGTAVDKTRAADCYRIAADRGLDWGMYNYATLLALGEGVAKDRATALDWLQRAAAMGNAKAINFVGSFAEDGWAGPCDMAKAADCYRQAAEGGDFRGCFNHARMLLDASQVEAALPWLTRAATLGNARFVRQMRDWIGRLDGDVRDRALAALPC
ncbi:tetratricopeptide repeat protein [Sphingomonas sp. R86521]|uniref:tetratricopeptide repeat protein n=1 Tax=Sphingomonas sp. R86521 TaxID=3093860 RepID=UPI0036D35BD9